MSLSLPARKHPVNKIMSGQRQTSVRRVGLYNVGRCIGRGTVGNVYEATHRPSKTRMAMKVIHRRDMIDPALGPRLRREIAIMKLLRHPHVVSVRAVV